MTMRQRLVISALFAALCPTLVQATYVDCEHIRVDGVSWKFTELKKAVTLDVAIDDSNAYGKTNLTIDVSLCEKLPQPSEKRDDSKKNQYCPTGSMICLTEKFFPDGDKDKPVIHNRFPIAGDFFHDGRPLDAKWERLKKSTQATDEKKEGLRGTFLGGVKVAMGEKKKQSAVIEFLCDHDRTGLEGVKELDPKALADDKDKDKKETDSSLKYVSYVTSNDKEDVLHLTWLTKHACEDEADFGNSSAHWGFFTWLLIIVFLTTATYLVFGSWINYSKNGARGWDLLPHSDAIRDVPYLLRDWTRKLIDTVSGGGNIRLGSSRGGYAAV